ncbi:MAG: VanW family protein [Romboutsia sp.]|uniref:VanW family protein n=1 Tax=Romboutsia sp. TaxID=1965302 RepID=UPI003F412DFA
MMNNARKKIFIGVSIIVAAILVFVLVMNLQVNSEKVVKNTYIDDVYIGELTKEEAIEELQKTYKAENIEVRYIKEKWNISGDKFDFHYDLDDTVKKAYEINHQGSFMKNIENTIKSNLGKKNNIKVNMTYNKEKLKSELEKIAKEINVEVKDASINIENSQVIINDGESGLNVNIDESIKNIIRELEKGNQKEELIVTKVEPTVKKEQLQEVDTLLGGYSTKFDSSVSGRSTNIRIAASRTSDVLLMPGDTFSYNEYTGMRTTANGYKNAPVIVQGVVQEGVGGGVCQVSSTLYNSVLYSGLELVSLKNHSIPSTYVIKGRDATVTDGGIDFVFKNNLKYPIYLKNYVSGNTVTCQIYGSAKDKQKIEIETNIDGVSVAPTKKVEDPTIPKGKEKELESGRNGYTVSTYRLYMDENGKISKREKVASSYYPKKQGVIAVGTMEAKPEVLPTKPEVPPTTPEVPPPTTPEVPPTTPEVPPPTTPEVPPTTPEVPPLPQDNGNGEGTTP